MDAVLRVSRVRGLWRAAIWAFPAIFLAELCRLMLGGSDFSNSGIDRRLVDAALLVVVVPTTLATMFCAFQSIRWLALACWPAPLVIEIDEKRIRLKLGPFGDTRHPWDRLQIRYPFDDQEAGDARTYESNLPIDVQIRVLLPIMSDRDRSTRVDLRLLRFAQGSEQDIAAQLGPFMTKHRSHLESLVEETMEDVNPDDADRPPDDHQPR